MKDIEVVEGFELRAGVYEDIVTGRGISPEMGLKHESFSGVKVLSKVGIEKLYELLSKYEEEDTYCEVFRQDSKVITATFRNPKYSREECVECNCKFNSGKDIVVIRFNNSTAYKRSLIRLHEECIQDFLDTLQEMLNFYDKRYILKGIFIQPPEETNSNLIQVHTNSDVGAPEYQDLDSFMQLIKNTYNNKLTEPSEEPPKNKCEYCYDENVKVYYSEFSARIICSECLDKLAFRYLDIYKNLKKQNTILKI